MDRYSNIWTLTCNMSSAIIEFEGFQLHPHSFIVKELSFYAIDDGRHNRWTFLPPSSWKKLSSKKRQSYAWVTRNCHLMKWKSGNLPYSQLRRILLSLFASFTTIYTKGPEKAKFLKKLSGREILDLNQLGCPKMKDLGCVAVRCPDHPPNFRYCALAKAAAYGSFIRGWRNSSGVI